MKEKKEQEMELIRNQLLTLFVQELRTPLSLIIAPLKEMLVESGLPPALLSKIRVAYRSSVSMLDSCSQLLSIYTQEVPKEKMTVTPYNAEKLVDAMVLGVSELVRVHNIDFQYEKRIRKEAEVWVDHRKISFVLRNMFTNALNHIRFSGTVVLLLEETVENGVPYCVITVTDNGEGDVKELGQVVENGELMTELASMELGFDTMEKMLLRHHGTIRMKSGKETDTVVTVHLPLEKNVLEKDAGIEFAR